jgi:hypothetical protein
VIIEFKNKGLAEIQDILINPYTARILHLGQGGRVQVSTTYPFRGFARSASSRSRRRATTRSSRSPADAGPLREDPVLEQLRRRTWRPARSGDETPASGRGRARLHQLVAAPPAQDREVHQLVRRVVWRQAPPRGGQRQAVAASRRLPRSSRAAVAHGRDTRSTTTRGRSDHLGQGRRGRGLRDVRLQGLPPVGKLSMPGSATCTRSRWLPPVPRALRQCSSARTTGAGYMEAARIRVYTTDAPEARRSPSTGRDRTRRGPEIGSRPTRR